MGGGSGNVKVSKTLVGRKRNLFFIAIALIKISSFVFDHLCIWSGTQSINDG